MEWIFVKTLGSSLAVIGLIIGIMIFVKKYFGSLGIPSQQHIPIEVLGSKNIHPKNSLHVVRVVDKVFVLGVSESGMEMLVEFEEAADILLQTIELEKERTEAKKILRESEQESSFAQSFRKQLSGLLLTKKHGRGSA